MIRSWLFAACALVLAACNQSAADAPISEQWRSISVDTQPVAFGRETVGKLRFRGGITVRSHEALFGGISGMEVLDNGRIIAISDRGYWFEARLQFDGEGNLTGIADVRAALMRDENADPFQSRRMADAEDMTQLGDGRIAVSFEHTQSIRIYDLNRDGPFGPAAPGPPLADTDDFWPNVGLEAIAATADGGLLVGAEGGDEPTTPMYVVRLGATTPTPPTSRFPLRDRFSLTSLDRAPDGSYVALERFYAPVVGARARIARFAGEEIARGGNAIVRTEELATLSPPLPLDNFEAISAVRLPNGVTRLYIASDNNYSPLQRTLILAFDIIEDAPAAR